jgi:hypothetical protein
MAIRRPANASTRGAETRLSFAMFSGPTTIKKWLRTGLATVAMLSMTEPAFASEDCIRHEDMAALKAAAMQQQLMVAALSCRATSLYNRFVLSYRDELQASDNTLKTFFQRRAGGEADYNSFKTQLANRSSLSSIRHTRSYCEEAYASFDAALFSDRHSLEDFVARQPVSLDLNWSECNESPKPSARNERRAAWFERRRAKAEEMEDDGPVAPKDHELVPDAPAY